jgi:CubicO group peptidase (beta-lactamase class C family)
MATTPTPAGLSRRRLLQIGVGSAGALVAGIADPATAAPKVASLDVLALQRPVYAGIWEPNGGGQYLRLDRTYDPFLADYGEMWGKNFRIRTLTSYVGEGNQVFYSAAYNASSAGQYLRLGRDYNGLLADFGEMWNRAFKLSTLSAYVRNGQVFYDATYDPNTNGQGLYVHKTHDEFAAAYGDMWNRGFRLAGLTSFVVNGQVYYTGYFNPSTSGQYLRLWRGRDQFLREVAELRAQGFGPAVLSTHVLGGVVYYNAAYNQVSPLIAIDEPYDEFVATYGEMWNKNYRLGVLVTDHVEALNVNEMARGINSRLAANVVGFSAGLATAGYATSTAAGLARTATNGSRASSAGARLNIASVNKTITAVGVLQCLAARGLTIDSTVHQYLPSDWTRGPNIRSITFRELLTHRSGFRIGSEKYADIKKQVEAGVTLTDKTTAVYRNENFAIFRIVIPYLDGFSEAGVTDKDIATSNWYLSYVNRRIFAPCGIATVRAKPETSNQTLCYPFPAGNVGGTDWGDWTTLTGGGCLNVSANELATFLKTLRETNVLLTPQQRQAMIDNDLGWQGHTPVRHGQVSSHGGFLWAPTPSNGQIQLNTVICSFSSGVHASVLVNSRIGNGVDLWRSVTDAYRDAWVAL